MICITFQGLVGPQGPIGPPGEKVSKASSLLVLPHNCKCFSQDLLSDFADILLSYRPYSPL